MNFEFENKEGRPYKDGNNKQKKKKEDEEEEKGEKKKEKLERTEEKHGDSIFA